MKDVQTKSAANKKQSLFLRILGVIGLVSLVPMLILIIFLNVRMYVNLKNFSHNTIMLLAENCALQIEGFLKQQFSSLRTLAGIAEGFEQYPAGQRRIMLSEMVRRTLLQNKTDILAAWMQMEPGALRDDPAPYLNTPLSAPNGGFDATWYFSGTTLEQGSITNETYEGDFYQLPKNTGQEMVLDPYFYSYSGSKNDEILETTLCVPLFNRDEFMGVTGFDIDLYQLQAIIESIQVPYNGYIVLLTNTTGMRLSHPDSSLIGNKIDEQFSDDVLNTIIAAMGTGTSFAVDRVFLPREGAVRIQFIPVHLGEGAENWYVALFLPLNSVYKGIYPIITWQLVFSLAAFLLMITFVSLTARKLSNPIIEMVGFTEAMAGGEFKGRLSYIRNDELGRLAASFNHMADRIQHLLAQYDKINRELEERVQVRTEELKKSIEELEATRDQVIRSEKLAVLGRLAANIAHELNTPLGAIESSVSLIEHSGPGILEEFPAVAGTLDKENTEDIRHLLYVAAVMNPAVMVQTDRKKRKEMVRRFADAGVEEPEALAENIMSYGISEEEERVLRLKERGGRRLLALVFRLISVNQAVAIIRQAVRKATLTVSAVGGYSRGSISERKEAVDPVEEIENLLVIYYNTLKQGISIKRDYRSRSRVYGNADQINQVLVNLINNAVQAMSLHGTLGLETADEGETVRISVRDNGPGIPQEVQPHIFEPFFSTKNDHSGTGLGLDICRSIVKEHRGRIEFSSLPGETVFSVYLPKFAEIRAEE